MLKFTVRDHVVGLTFPNTGKNDDESHTERHDIYADKRYVMSCHVMLYVYVYVCIYIYIYIYCIRKILLLIRYFHKTFIFQHIK